MASLRSATSPKKTNTASAAKGGEGPGRLADYLLARAPAEDVAAYDVADLERAADLAGRAVARHRKGDSVVAIDVDSGVVRQGRPMTVITVVNDNMPFLFDSILGEITESAGEPLLVTHPVIVARHGKSGVDEILGDGGFAKGDHSHDRLSVVHVHIGRLSADQAEALAGRLKKLLGQVHAAVTDWKPMLARLDQAISEFRYAPVPLDKAHVTEAIAFLEWLRDDNFTFLGMREFKYTGGEKSGTLERSDKPGLGILSDPDVLVLQTRHRSGDDDAGNPCLPAWAGPADRHQGQRQVVGAPPHLPRLHRRQDLYRQGRAGGRVAHRRPVHLDRLHAFGDEDPLSALEGRNRHRQIRLQSRRPFRQGADQRAGESIHATNCSRFRCRSCAGTPKPFWD